MQLAALITGIVILVIVLTLLYLKRNVRKSKEKFVAIRAGIRENKRALTDYGIRFTGFQGVFEHMILIKVPETLRPLHSVKTRLVSVTPPFKAPYYQHDYFKAIAANALPFRAAPLSKFEKLSDAIAALNPPAIFEDRCAYRLLQIREENDQLILDFDKSRGYTYFDQVNFQGLLEHELAYEFYHRKWTLTKNDIPELDLRQWTTKRLVPSRFMNYTDGMYFVGVSAAVLIIQDGQFRLLLHKRAATGTEPGLVHLVPSGEFQPVNSEGAFNTDCDFWRCILREYCEEICGEPELKENFGSETNYEVGIYKKVSDLIPYQNRFLLGIGMDPVTYKVEILACLVLTYDQFLATLGGSSKEEQLLSLRKVIANTSGEGELLHDGVDRIGIAVNPADGFRELDHHIQGDYTLNAAKTAMTIIKKQYGFLAGKFLS